MSGKDNTTELPVESGDPLAAKIRDSILGLETLRGENRRLADEIIVRTLRWPIFGLKVKYSR